MTFGVWSSPQTVDYCGADYLTVQTTDTGMQTHW